MYPPSSTDQLATFKAALERPKKLALKERKKKSQKSDGTPTSPFGPDRTPYTPSGSTPYTPGHTSYTPSGSTPYSPDQDGFEIQKQTLAFAVRCRGYGRPRHCVWCELYFPPFLSRWTIWKPSLSSIPTRLLTATWWNTVGESRKNLPKGASPWACLASWRRSASRSVRRRTRSFHPCPGKSC